MALPWRPPYKSATEVPSRRGKSVIKAGLRLSLRGPHQPIYLFIRQHPIHLYRIMTTRTARLCVACGFCLLAFTRSPIAQESVASDPPLTFRSAVDVVTIQASVRDTRGRIVGGLRPKDFE